VLTGHGVEAHDAIALLHDPFWPRRRRFGLRPALSRRGESLWAPSRISSTLVFTRLSSTWRLRSHGYLSPCDFRRLTLCDPSRSSGSRALSLFTPWSTEDHLSAITQRPTHVLGCAAVRVAASVPPYSAEPLAWPSTSASPRKSCAVHTPGAKLLTPLQSFPAAPIVDYFPGRSHTLHAEPMNNHKLAHQKFDHGW